MNENFSYFFMSDFFCFRFSSFSFITIVMSIRHEDVWRIKEDRKWRIYIWNLFWIFKLELRKVIWTFFDDCVSDSFKCDFCFLMDEFMMAFLMNINFFFFWKTIGWKIIGCFMRVWRVKRKREIISLPCHFKDLYAASKFLWISQKFPSKLHLKSPTKSV